jgi:hypothetical protein
MKLQLLVSPVLSVASFHVCMTHLRARCNTIPEHGGQAVVLALHYSVEHLNILLETNKLLHSAHNQKCVLPSNSVLTHSHEWCMTYGKEKCSLHWKRRKHTYWGENLIIIDTSINQNKSWPAVTKIMHRPERWRWTSSGMLHSVVWWKFTNIWEMLTAAIINVLIMEAVSTSGMSVN